MKIVAFFFLVFLFFSCSKKTDESPIPYSEATYRVIISMNWASPLFSVPASAHVTPLIGIVHSKDTFLWMPGMLATAGLEDVAEIGNNAKMNAELDAILQKNKGLSKFTLTPPAITDTVESNLNFNTDFPYVSFASMIAPSPDWFMGIHDFSLLNNKEWIADVTLNLMVYDAGTEEGNVFGYDNSETNPRQNISLLTPVSVLANGNASIAPIGTIRFIKN